MLKGTEITILIGEDILGKAEVIHISGVPSGFLNIGKGVTPGIQARVFAIQITGLEAVQDHSDLRAGNTSIGIKFAVFIALNQTGVSHGSKDLLFLVR